MLDTALARYGDMALGDISRHFVREWIAELSTEMAPASVHTTVGVLRQVLAMAMVDNRLTMNPVDGVELPPVDGLREQRFLTLEQLHALALAAGENRALVYVLGTCGLRFGEAAELRWRDVDGLRLRIARSVTLVDGRFVVGSPKNGKGRTVSLPAFVADLLVRGEPDALVFPAPRPPDTCGVRTSGGGGGHGRSPKPKLFPRKVAGEETPVYEFKLHELRHTAASLAIQAGANIKALQNMLGHESAGLTLDRYGHLYGSDVEAVGVAINVLLTRGCGQNVGTERIPA